MSHAIDVPSTFWNEKPTNGDQIDDPEPFILLLHAAPAYGGLAFK
jgi:hypothetical protein